MKQAVLFLVFNRLETCQQVFESIRQYKPRKLYLAADGPRAHRPEEAGLCKGVREWVLNHIDWDCETKTLFQQENLGCGLAPQTAISWFFANEEEGIILEDDCVPNGDFFLFCENMLDYYRKDDRISIISGCNFDTQNQYSTSDSYFFSAFPYTWGWATWKQNWVGYDYNLKEWLTISKKTFLKNNIFTEKKYYEVWREKFDELSLHTAKDIWDYQFFFQCFKRKQLSVVPSVNTVSNIGCGDMATHTVKGNDPMLNRSYGNMSFPLNHPNTISRNLPYDIYLQKLNYGEIEQVSILKRLKRKIKKILIGILS